MNLTALFLPVIVGLGLVTTYTDVKIGKIRNTHLITAVSLSFVINLFLVYYQIVPTGHAVKLLIYTLISLILSFALYYFGLWSAGDAKLFTTYVALVPPTTYHYSSTVFQPGSIFVNTIVPIFLVLTASLLIRTSLKDKWEITRNMMTARKLGTYLLIVFSLSWPIQILMRYLGWRTSIITTMIGIMLLKEVISMLFKGEQIYLLIGIGALRLIFETRQLTSFAYIKSFIIMTVSYMLLITVLNELGKKMVSDIKISSLKPGMIPAEMVMKEGKKYVKAELESNSFGKVTEGAVYNTSVDGLTESDIKILKKLDKSKRLKFGTILIRQTIPFAQYLFIGSLLTLLFQGNAFLALSTFI